MYILGRGSNVCLVWHLIALLRDLCAIRKHKSIKIRSILYEALSKIEVALHSTPRESDKEFFFLPQEQFSVAFYVRFGLGAR